ncbi:hypothetical protein SBA5_940004 [Candidatus Sulfotelmatomonas gaucii]|uniref:Uncharacterized protein n=1 Tax=Candidatus Sulfuritelmatomonas gaucii TaxID=2043161 RepID=A0A2N9M9J7_9BACT|nr:hypothetical protein SBA5_940004 [Candidatus Sulfotelmatomonas gaucii]
MYSSKRFAHSEPHSPHKSHTIDVCIEHMQEEILGSASLSLMRCWIGFGTVDIEVKQEALNAQFRPLPWRLTTPARRRLNPLQRATGLRRCGLGHARTSKATELSATFSL